MFVWDHLRWREPVVDVADTQILAAIVRATERIRLGPMVTPWRAFPVNNKVRGVLREGPASVV